MFEVALLTCTAFVKIFKIICSHTACALRASTANNPYLIFNTLYGGEYLKSNSAHISKDGDSFDRAGSSTGLIVLKRAIRFPNPSRIQSSIPQTPAKNPVSHCCAQLMHKAGDQNDGLKLKGQEPITTATLSFIPLALPSSLRWIVLILL